MTCRICAPNETEDLYMHVYNTMTGINESKILTKHVSTKCECKFYSIKCYSNQKWNKDKCRFECKKLKEHYVCKKDYICDPVSCSWESSKYLGSIIEDSAITCDVFIETTGVPTKSTLKTSL